MTNFQNGVTSSDLSPQSFKNSSQNVNFQKTYKVSGTQSNSSQALHTVNPGTLRVDDGSSVQVLGVSRFAPQTNSSTVQKSNSYVPVAMVILVITAALALYFLKRYRNLSAVKEELSEDE